VISSVVFNLSCHLFGTGCCPVWLSGIPGSFVMSTQKLDHIPELTGINTYHGWSQAMVLVLQGNGLWNHVSEGMNRLDPLNFARSRPPISISSSDIDFDALLKWQLDDAKVQELLLRHMSSQFSLLCPCRSPCQLSSLPHHLPLRVWAPLLPWGGRSPKRTLR
jgi:hypothetical protein